MRLSQRGVVRVEPGPTLNRHHLDQTPDSAARRQPPLA
jgi:hypothetical protein